MLKKLFLLGFLLIPNSFYPSAEASKDPHCGAHIKTTFYEGAPRDRFQLSNLSSTQWQITEIVLDLTNSKGGLIFDTREGGTGVEVFQSFKTEKGKDLLHTEINVQDGDKTIKMQFAKFVAGEEYIFSIDVDDQLDNSELGQIRDSDNEIEGAEIQAQLVNDEGKSAILTSIFRENAVASSHYQECS